MLFLMIFVSFETCACGLNLESWFASKLL